MTLDMTTVERTAQLAKLSFSAAEKEQVLNEMEKILNFVEKIKAVNTEGVTPLTHCLANTHVTRDDVPGASLPRTLIENGAPAFENGCFVIPRVMD